MLLTRIMGIITGVMIVLALSNFFLKQISRDYVKNLPLRYKDFADAYRSFMQRMIRSHRVFGISAIVSLMVHAGMNIYSGHASVTGIISAIFLAATAGLGAYGYYVSRNLRAWWLTMHKACGFVLVLSVLVHLFCRIDIFF